MDLTQLRWEDFFDERPENVSDNPDTRQGPDTTDTAAQQVFARNQLSNPLFVSAGQKRPASPKEDQESELTLPDWVEAWFKDLPGENSMGNNSLETPSQHPVSQPLTIPTPLVSPTPTIPIQTFWGRDIEIIVKINKSFEEAIFNSYNPISNKFEITTTKDNNKKELNPDEFNYIPKTEQENLFLLREGCTDQFRLVKIRKKSIKKITALSAYFIPKNNSYLEKKEATYSGPFNGMNCLPLPKDLLRIVEANMSKMSNIPFANKSAHEQRNTYINNIIKDFETQLSLKLQFEKSKILQKKDEFSEVLATHFNLQTNQTP